jgi:hypothetical protein
MSTRRAWLSSSVACVVLVGLASPRAARAAEEAPEPVPPVLVALDFDAIPSGVLPAAPRAGDAPPSAANERVPGVKLKKIRSAPRKKKLPPGLLAKMGKRELVELTPDHPEIAAMYAPAPEGAEFEGESVSRMACRRQDPPSPVRWETLSVGPDGNAKLEVKDLWFFADSCSVGLGSTTQVAFKAIAWEGGRPWLFAMRDEKTVTFVMPRANDVSADAMVGTPLTIRGGFTRVSLPIGRWGASSFVAHLATLELKPPPSPAKAKGKGRVVEAESEETTSDTPVEIAVELVQTMSESFPTLLVRRDQPDTSATDAPTE